MKTICCETATLKSEQFERPGRSTGQSAFTLIELLMVIGVLGVLSSISVGTVVKAKEKARQIQCLENLRQHGLALNRFVQDHGAYPLAMNPGYYSGRYKDHHVSWEGSLFRERLGKDIASNGGEFKGVFRCPTAQRPNDFPPHLLYPSYGYNSDGLVGHPQDSPLGLGGKGTENGFAPPISESEVVNPSQMLGVGDAFIGWNGVIEDGKVRIARLFSARDFLDSTRRASLRHRGRANVVFCDGHASGLSLEFLFSDVSDGALRIWNRDNKPHQERMKQ